MRQVTEQRLNDLLEQFISAGVPGCALAVSYHGEKVYEGYRGFARLEDKKVFDKDTICRIFSNSKNITSTAAMILYEQGKILLNDPVEMYLPSFKNGKYKKYDGSGEITVHPVSRPVTIKDLLMMTSGIPYGGRGSATTEDYMDDFGNGRSLSVQEMAEKIGRIPLSFDPGTHWQYGWGYDVLGAVIEVVTGKTLSAFIKDEILDPLGMNHTSFYCSDTDNLANIYSFNDGKYEKIVDDMFISDNNGNRLESGGGGMVSILDDMLKFSTMWAMGGVSGNTRIISRNTIDLMRTNHLEGQLMEDFVNMSKDSYPWYKGYGWGLAGRTLVSKQDAGSIGSIGEFGWCGAAGTYILADPEKELAIAYFHQMMPVIGGMQDYCHPRVRNVVYSLID